MLRMWDFCVKANAKEHFWKPVSNNSPRDSWPSQRCTNLTLSKTIQSCKIMTNWANFSGYFLATAKGFSHWILRATLISLIVSNVVRKFTILIWTCLEASSTAKKSPFTAVKMFLASLREPKARIKDWPLKPRLREMSNSLCCQVGSMNRVPWDHDNSCLINRGSHPQLSMLQPWPMIRKLRDTPEWLLMWMARMFHFRKLITSSPVLSQMSITRSISIYPSFMLTVLFWLRRSFIPGVTLKSWSQDPTCSRISA